MNEVSAPLRTVSRRAAVGTVIAAAGSALLPGRGGTGGLAPAAFTASAEDGPRGYVAPDGPEVLAAERARRTNGRVRTLRVTAVEGTVDLGGRTVRTWTYGGELPGKEIRLTAGDTLALTLRNHLPESTSAHWHGLRVRNDMDGVPGLTQAPIKAGADYSYRFAVIHPGTYWFHPHTGVQQDRGMYAPLIVDDPREPLEYDREWVVVLDDWLDGVDGSTPDAVLTSLTHGAGGVSHGDHGGDHGEDGDHGGDRPSAGTDDGRDRVGGQSARDRADGERADGDGDEDGPADGPANDIRDPADPGDSGPAPRVDDPSTGPGGPNRVMRSAHSDLLDGDGGDVDYPCYLVNGRTSRDPRGFTARPGDRIRIRFVNAGGDTAFRVALGGHRMTVTHSDGYPVQHRETDALLLGMGERYDVLVTAGDGVFPLVALAEGKGASALDVLRTGPGRAPTAATRPTELEGRLLAASDLKPDPSVALPDRTPDRTVRLTLTGSPAVYNWGFDHRSFDPARRRDVRAGERVRLSFVNHTRMWHPVHLHGHSFALAGGGPRKDTAIVLPGRTVHVDLDADNPGLWMLHCHNAYHAHAGMMTVLGYLR